MLTQETIVQGDVWHNNFVWQQRPFYRECSEIIYEKATERGLAWKRDTSSQIHARE